MERERARNPVPRDQWVDGQFTAPHGACFDADGNLYVMDWNASGRMTRMNRTKRTNRNRRSADDSR